MTQLNLPQVQSETGLVILILATMLLFISLPIEVQEKIMKFTLKGVNLILRAPGSFRTFK